MVHTIGGIVDRIYGRDHEVKCALQKSHAQSFLNGPRGIHHMALVSTTGSMKPIVWAAVLKV
jgi:hypothetical protein